MLLIDNKDSVFCIIYFFNLAFTTIFHDRNNLYNTNDQFDYGGFRALMEAQSQVATSPPSSPTSSLTLASTPSTSAPTSTRKW